MCTKCIQVQNAKKRKNSRNLKGAQWWIEQLRRDSTEGSETKQK